MVGSIDPAWERWFWKQLSRLKVWSDMELQRRLRAQLHRNPMPIRGAATPGRPPPPSLTGWGLPWKSLVALEGQWMRPLFLISSPPPGLLGQKLQRIGVPLWTPSSACPSSSGLASHSFDVSEESQPLFFWCFLARRLRPGLGLDEVFPLSLSNRGLQRPGNTAGPSLLDFSISNYCCRKKIRELIRRTCPIRHHPD